MKRGIYITLTVLFGVSLLLWIGVRIFCSVNLDFKCLNYLKRAADANTIEMAKPNLDTAIEYLEENNLTSGIVSIFLKNPANDIKYFYQNLKASQAELEMVDQNATQLEKSNVLMKLRETLVDEVESTSVTCPDGLSIYPYNLLYFWWLVLSLIGLTVFWLLAFFADYY